MRGIEEAADKQKEDKQKADRNHAAQVRVGIVGYGTVGRATAEILAGHAAEIQQRTGGVSIVVTRIARRKPKSAEMGVNGIAVCADWRQVVDADDENPPRASGPAVWKRSRRRSRWPW